MSEREQDIKRIEEAVATLSDHFDTVQIFATRHEPATEDGTISVQIGAGNYYARYGHVCEWMMKQNEGSRLKKRQEDSDS